MPTSQTISQIWDVQLIDLKIIPTEGGAVLHFLRSDSPYFQGFGEVYFSEIMPQELRAWKCHTLQTQNFAVPVGLMKIVLSDDRPTSPSRGQLQEVILGRPDHFQLLQIPPLIWYGFQAISAVPAMICNVVNLPHDPAEARRKPVSEIAYSW